MISKYNVKVIDRYGEVDKYNLKINGVVGSAPVTYTLKYKRNDHSLYPEYRGKKVISMVDTGNEVVVEKVSGETLSLDYAEFQELFILMTAENQLHTKVIFKIKENASN